MLQITIPASEEEYWDEAKEEFVYKTVGKEQTLSLEHSLVSLRKWESKWHKPFFDKKEKKTREEELDYIKCMTLTKNVDPEMYSNLTEENMTQIREYIEDPMTATTFHDEGVRTPNREKVTAELIYYWMIAHQIPVEFEKWHINQLLTLIRVCNVKNTPPKKQNRGEMMRNRAALNAARRKKLNTKG